MEEVDIIVADAESRTRAVLEVALRQRGYRVLGLSLATRILPRVDAAPVAVIVVDASLGLSSIVALALQLNERGLHRPSLLAIAEISERDERIALVDAGVDEIVERPIYLRDVIARIEVLLARRQSRALLRGDMAGAGPLGTLGVMDLIHHLSGGGFTGRLHLQRRSMRAALAFDEGALVDARSEREAGMPVLVRALGWTEGSFRIEAGAPDDGAPSLCGETAELLQEALGAQVRVQAARDSRIGPDRVLVVHYRTWTEHEELYPAEAEALIRIFDGLRPVEDVIALAALPDEEGWKLVHQLLADGILHDVDRRPRPARPSRAAQALALQEAERVPEAADTLAPPDSSPVSVSLPASLSSPTSRRRATGPWRALPDPAEVQAFEHGQSDDGAEDWRTPALVDVRDRPPDEQGDTGPWRLASASEAVQGEAAPETQSPPGHEKDPLHAAPHSAEGQPDASGAPAPLCDAGRTGPWHSTREEKPSLDELAQAREVALSAGSVGAEWSVGPAPAGSGAADGGARVIERTPPSAPRSAEGVRSGRASDFEFEAPESTGPGVMKRAEAGQVREAAGAAESAAASPRESSAVREPEPIGVSGPASREAEPAHASSADRTSTLSPDVLASWYVGVEGEEGAQEWLTQPMSAISAPPAEEEGREEVEWPPVTLAPQRFSPLPILIVLTLLALSVAYLVMTGDDPELAPAQGDAVASSAEAAVYEGSASGGIGDEGAPSERAEAFGAARSTRVEALEAAQMAFDAAEVAAEDGAEAPAGDGTAPPAEAPVEEAMEAPPAPPLPERAATAALAPTREGAEEPSVGCRDTSLAAARRREACRQEIAQSPRSVEAHLVLGSLLYDAGDLAAALPVLEEAVRLSPRSAHAWLQLGAARQEQGVFDGAREAYVRYLELVPDGRRAAEIRSVLEGLP